MLAYQREAGFTGRDLDDIPGPFDQTAGNPDALVADGWDLSRYDNPAHLLWLLCRHAWAELPKARVVALSLAKLDVNFLF